MGACCQSIDKVLARGELERYVHLPFIDITQSEACSGSVEYPGKFIGLTAIHSYGCRTVPGSLR